MRMETKVVLVHFSFLKLLSEKKLLVIWGARGRSPNTALFAAKLFHWWHSHTEAIRGGGLQILRYYSLRERGALLLNMRVETRKAA